MRKKNIIVGTAGHIDHGKSSIIKIITGIDPDRLIEEQKRGITIDLGFAYLEKGDISFSFVDVPGHEDYLKNMVAGAIGFDICICAVDVNEGIMPQTIEHMNIVRYLGVDNVVVVITKIDKAGDSLNDSIKKIENYFSKFQFKRLSFIKWSIYDKTAIDDLVKILIDYALGYERKVVWDIFLLNIDRVFTLKGFGTIVTGSVLSGELSQGDTVRIMPSGIETKVKGLSVHSKNVGMVEAGCRAAINLQNLGKEEVDRGDIITKGEVLQNFNAVYGEITHFDTGFEIKLKHGGEYTFLIGTAVRSGRIYFINEKYIRVTFKDGYPFLPEMKMLIRLPNPKITVAGVKILFVGEVRWSKSRLIDYLTSLSIYGVRKGLFDYLQNNISLHQDELYQKFLLHLKDLSKDYLLVDRYIFLKDYLDGIINRYLEKLQKEKSLKLDRLNLFENNILRRFISDEIINSAKKMGYIFVNGELREELEDNFENVCITILKNMESNLSLSNPSVVSEQLGIDKNIVNNCFKMLINKELIKRIDRDGNYVPTEILKKFFVDAVKLCKVEGYLDITNVKKIIVAPRKILIPLLELLDASGNFENIGNKRYFKQKK